MVKVSDTVYRHNRRHIQKTNEPSIAAHREAGELLPTPPEDNLATPSDPSSEAAVIDHEESTVPRRFSRICRTPVWHKDYVSFVNLPKADMC